MIYLNDILIVSETEKKNKIKIRKILQLLAEMELKVKEKKCIYFQKLIKFLRFILTEEKIKKDSAKLKCIQN